MAAQKLFQDFPKNVSGMAGMVTPAITSDIFQKAEVDDPSTLAGYKARLAAQRAEEEAAYGARQSAEDTRYRSRLDLQRSLQQQWQEEDLKKQADQMRQLDQQKREAFNVIYRPQAESGIRLTQQAAMGRAAAANPQVMNMSNMAGRPGVMFDQGTGVTRIPGFGIVGPPLGGPQPGQVQQALDTMYGRQATAAMAQNTNPYYKNPYIR